jgi:hypothetical protein
MQKLKIQEKQEEPEQISSMNFISEIFISFKIF